MPVAELIADLDGPSFIVMAIREQIRISSGLHSEL